MTSRFVKERKVDSVWSRPMLSRRYGPSSVIFSVVHAACSVIFVAHFSSSFSFISGRSIKLFQISGPKVIRNTQPRSVV